MLTTQFINEMQASEEFIRDMEAYNKEFPVDIEAMFRDLDANTLFKENSSFSLKPSA